MENPEILEILNEIPNLRRIVSEGVDTVQNSQLKTEVERTFAEKYGLQYGTLDEFINTYFNIPTPSSSSNETPLRSNFDPCSFFDPSLKRRYVPKIIASGKKTIEFNVFDFLTKSFENREEIPIEFLDYEPQENRDLLNSHWDTSMKEIVKLALVLNHSKELNYSIVEIQEQKL
jgi:hypothetical protein